MVAQNIIRNSNYSKVLKKTTDKIYQKEWEVIEKEFDEKTL